MRPLAQNAVPIPRVPEEVGFISRIAAKKDYAPAPRIIDESMPRPLDGPKAVVINASEILGTEGRQAGRSPIGPGSQYTVPFPQIMQWLVLVVFVASICPSTGTAEKHKFASRAIEC